MILKNKSRLLVAVTVAGFTSITVQIILLREFLVIFNGNELIFGIILANWMFLTGIGSFLGRWKNLPVNPYPVIIGIQVLMAILPVVIVFLLYFFRNEVFITGRMLGLVEIFYTSLILLLPFCLISGFLFTFLCASVSEFKKDNKIGAVYGLESIGSMIGGGLFNFVLVFFFDTFQSLTVVMAINFLAAGTIALGLIKRWYFLVPVVSVAIIGLMFIFPLDDISTQRLYKGQELVVQKETPYGSVVITRMGEQLNMHENGVVLFTSRDVVLNEESVHYAMVQHPEAKRVLLISGGMTGMLQEMKKYPVERIEYVEINPWLVRIGESFFGRITDTNVRIHFQDARLFVKQSAGEYDVILMNLPEPSTAQFNRYYSMEFFRDVKARLQAGGVICTGLASTANYMSDEALKTNSVLYNTLMEVFDQVEVISGSRNFYLASDREMTYRIAGTVDSLGVETLYVNAYYLNDELIRKRSELILQVLDDRAGVNTDLKPLSYFHHLRLWLSYFHAGITQPVILFSIILLVFVIFLKPVNLGLFTGGFTAASVEFILLIVFQVIYGYVYQMTGVVIMTFMGGLALGSLALYRWIRNANARSFSMVMFLIALLCMLFPLIIRGMMAIRSWEVIIHIIFLSLILMFSVLAGIQFKLASLLTIQPAGKLAGTLYAVDLAGSAFGALLVASFLLPLLGVDWVCVILGALNILAAVNVWFRGRGGY